jgi:hypothetical protein
VEAVLTILVPEVPAILLQHHQVKEILVVEVVHQTLAEEAGQGLLVLLVTAV